MATKLNLPYVSSPFAQEGTAAHALGELNAMLAFGKITSTDHRLAIQRWRTEFGYPDGVPSEMEIHCNDGYVGLLKERAALHPDTQVLMEQKVNTGVPRCWGTADAILVSPEHVEIVDLKYGQGVAVDATDNSQLMLYGIGALEGYGDLLGTVKTVYMTVFQPRLNNTSTFEMSAEDLRAWRDGLLPIAEEALGYDAHFGPSEAACRWCPAAGLCPAQMEAATKEDFSTDPDLLTPVDLAEALERVPLIRSWLAALESTALRMAYSESTPIPGWKVVMSGGRRVVADEKTALEVLDMLGYGADSYSSRSIRGIGELEKLLGRKQFATLLADYYTKTDGKPALVPEGDKRPAATPNQEAAKEFSNEAD